MTDASTSPAGPGPSVISEADVSCRLPLFVMFVSAAVWLVIASFFGLLSTLKFHSPNILADIPSLTYGRVRPAYFNSLLYGFCVQAGLGVTLWLFVKLGRAKAFHRWIITIGMMLWNLGVTIGIIGILIGDSTGFENLEFPYYAAVIMFIGYLVFGIWTVLTFHRRGERPLFVSQWFLLAGLFWFPWIYSTAYLLLTTFPVRGMAQAVLAWWFSNNLQVVWLGLTGLGTIFYFVPRLTNRELHSSYLALFVFWLWLLFASWGGIPGSAPVPAWLPALSTAATVMLIIPLIAVGINILATLQGQCASVKSSVPLQFIVLGFFGFLLAGLMNIGSVLPQSASLLNLTWFTLAKVHANTYAFFAMAMFGAVYYILPQLAGGAFCPVKLKVHLWLSIAGILFIILPLAIGGLVQGLQLQNPNIAFIDVSNRSLLFLRISTLGDFLIAAGHVVFLINIGGLVSAFLKARATVAYSAATADLFAAAEAES